MTESDGGASLSLTLLRSKSQGVNRKGREGHQTKRFVLLLFLSPLPQQIKEKV